MSNQELLTKWTETAKQVLEGRTIVVDNGTNCILSCDDEGNDGGVLFYGEHGVLPTF